MDDKERDARIDADVAFLEELEALEAGETDDEPLDLDADVASEPADEPRGDIADRLRDPNLKFGSLRFLSALTRGESGAVREVWPTLPVERRRRLVRAMDDLAELTVELDFARVLRIAMRDGDAEVRMRAIAALWEHESPDFLVALLDLLHTDPSAEVRQAAAKALGLFAVRAVLGNLTEPLTLRLHDDLLATAQDLREPIEVRRPAIESLGPFNDEPVAALIMELYDRGDREDRVSALFAMGRSANPRWFGTLMDEIEVEESDVRFEAARALGELGQAEAVPALIDRLEDEDRAVRIASVIALGQIGSRNATSALREHRADAEDEEWTDAIDAALAEAAYGDQPLFPL
ncbi:MAG: HEAT repeat domain-containing protein [Thermomicrobia bacterium]|nr:HEAT repeat domain-containing protein [Thermomicrobia bacterium]